MSFGAWIRRQFFGEVGNPTEIDYAPIGGQKLPEPKATLDKPVKPPAPPDWAALRKAAAERHGKPFRCAADGMPREILIDGEGVDIRRVKAANVTKLADRKRKP